MKSAIANLAGTCVLLLSVTLASAADGIEVRPIHFEKGASSATVEGSIQGDSIVDYKLGARAGQSMAVSLSTSNPSSYFNVLPPGSTEVAIFVGATSGNDWTGTLPDNGEYTVRVYMMRSAARRNETARYTLTVGITGGAKAAPGVAPEGDAKVAGTAFHATGTVPCSMGEEPKGSKQCQFGVVRGTSGNAQVHLRPPGGLERVLIFAGGRITADGGSTVRSSRDGDLWTVEVNDYEHYQIPEAVVTGG